jgi:hypothetical protein
MNEKHFSVIYTLITVGVVYLASKFGIPALRIFSSSMQSVALWLLSNIGLVVFLNGLGCDVHREITEDGNVALGLMVGLYSVGIAIVIHG